MEAVVSIVTNIVTVIGDVFGIFTDHPIALIPVGMGVLAGAVGLTKSILNTKRRGRRG